MKIEVKAVKHFPSLSEETNCFTCTVYVDGKRIAEAENRGFGGETMILPLHGKRDELEVVRDWAKSQPAREYPARWGMEAFTLPNSLESMVDDLVDDEIMRQELKRICKGHIAFVNEGNDWTLTGECWRIKVGFNWNDREEKEREALKAKIEKDHGQPITILNEML